MLQSTVGGKAMCLWRLRGRRGTSGRWHTAQRCSPPRVGNKGPRGAEDEEVLAVSEGSVMGALGS